MAPYGEVLRFSESRELWQQDLIRRLHSNPGYVDFDVEEGLAMLKAHIGVLPPEEAPTPEPLTERHMPYIAPDPPQVVLHSLANPRHVNRLAQTETLRFGTRGLTVIYGDNGSGKSGYFRLLKRTCRVRAGGEERILGNVFEAEAAPPAEVSIRFAVAGEERDVRWTEGIDPPQELSLISVFDARVAPLYADEENKVEYLPQGLDILPRLGDLCKRLAGMISAEIQAVQRRVATPLPIFSAGTTVGVTIEKLDTGTPLQQLPTTDELTLLAEWTEEGDARLTEVQAALDSEPEVSETRCRELRNVIGGLITEFTAVEDAFGNPAIEQLHQQHQDVVAAVEAARLAASDVFRDALLPGIGSLAWKRMFEYAKEFSATAYPDQGFPVVGGDKRCLLCLQPLSEDASARLLRFEQFVKDRAQAEALRLQGAITQTKEGLRRTSVRNPRDAEALMSGAREFADIGDTAINASTAYLQSITSRQPLVVSALTGEIAFDAIPACAPCPVDFLAELCRCLQEREEAFALLRDPQRRLHLEREKSELIARKQLSESIATIIQRGDDLRELAQLQQCKSACDTTSISKRNSEMRTTFYTEEFQRRLVHELETFGLQEINFRVDARSAGGANLIDVRVAAQVNVNNRDVLSDGEFRALALACFFAEVGGITDHSSIIFDDPVSSLDHVRTRRVAERLIAAAANGRQVIIFTHDLVFYYELWSLAAERQVPLARHWLRYTEERGFGTVGENEEPWEVKKVAQRLQQLQQRLALIREVPDRGERYRAIAKDFYTDLRETWERLVEEMLLNQVVNRFQPGVRTLSLKGVVVDDDDYRRIFFGMKRASECSGHDRAQARQVAPPEPDEMVRDLTEIVDYNTALRTRRNVLQPRREALEGPPNP